MNYSVKRSTIATVVGLSTLMLLSACSTDQRYKRQVSGDESYLQASELHELKAPAGMILPVQRGDYDVPRTASQGPTGKQLDIRPPAQPLALMNGTRAQFSNNTGALIIDNSRGSVWSQVVNVVQSYKFPIASRNDAGQQLTTDWVQWNRADEDQQYRGRYQISVQSQSYQQLLTVRLLELQQDGKTITSPAQIQRYTAQMLNDISTGMDKIDTASENAASGRVNGAIDVQSGADDTGLPMLILRTPYNVAWQRLPDAMKRVGMEVTDTTRSTGSMKVTYKSLSSSDWDSVGAKDPELPNGDYKVQVGDLDNRTSLQFIDPKGHVLTQSQNDALVAVFQAALNK
ncbi:MULTISPECIES: outer membrane protein assembly factor BamC [Pantoea]|jgi:outer membrane protein assembly factor BamC|uniref:Outer membrane protein assembly factor BamC n=1 Tax=Pantoea anthophila TaxID=470931 RepID=A0ABY2ZDC0_9GAMM|nr:MULTISPECIES: outer membrane protein assembly factor BamC [Pantoea]TPE12036.1 outer membrane protein assembly factor BamC [Pantoea vagans]EIB97982.1 lipoprotein [Pantoea sp. Sc1]KAF6663322.1 outer membrane protein assembly factor BamC [Pantoea sp. EKM101V]KKB03825.1 outer membrane protein assembly factor BamC [Pantoea anthophila]MEB5707148.1 outer membrane protein assembly factor BamC [Pantoea anthophila]